MFIGFCVHECIYGGVYVCVIERLRHYYVPEKDRLKSYGQDRQELFGKQRDQLEMAVLEASYLLYDHACMYAQVN